MSAPERKAVQDAVASLERTLGIEGKYEAGLIAAADRIAKADAEIATLRAEVERLRADAERYRWLRGDAIYWLEIESQPSGEAVYCGSPSGLDAAIDTARGVKS